jgi:hypothetical protein
MSAFRIVRRGGVTAREATVVSTHATVYAAFTEIDGVAEHGGTAPTGRVESDFVWLPRESRKSLTRQHAFRRDGLETRSAESENRGQQVAPVTEALPGVSCASP